MKPGGQQAARVSRGRACARATHLARGERLQWVVPSVRAPLLVQAGAAACAVAALHGRAVDRPWRLILAPPVGSLLATPPIVACRHEAAGHGAGSLGVKGHATSPPANARTPSMCNARGLCASRRALQHAPHS